MSSSQNFIECPACEFDGASQYEESNGEAFIACPLCGFYEDITEYDPDYFDSEEEWTDAQAEIEEKKVNIPTEKEVMIAKQIIKISKFLNSDILNDFIINNDGPYENLNQFFELFSKDLKTDGRHYLIKGIYDPKFR